MDLHGNVIEKIKEKYTTLYGEYCDTKTKLKENYGDDKEKQRKLDLLKYQVNEIEEANLKIGEEEELDNIRSRMLNSEKISASLNEADLEISENAIESISNAIRSLEKIDNLDTAYEEKLNNLKSVYYDLQELGRDIDNLKDEIEFDEEERQKVETRLDLIFSLKRKYGNNIEEILKYKEDIQSEIEQIENLEEYRNNLKGRIEQLEKDMFELAQEMNKIREKNAQVLSNKISNELSELEMKSATLKINVVFNEKKEFNKDGLDKVEFLIKTNAGEDFKPLIKIASGGEMSRIMLAIKNVLANVDKVPVLIFDEIDTGISGIAAKSVATKMKQIANNHQVICVTHLAPIAASGDYNYYISKKVINDTTKTEIHLLSEEETIREIARIASGDVTEIALQHARELREVNNNHRN
jgi:DNA repair protein RecN (Recombination protein N)